MFVMNRTILFVFVFFIVSCGNKKANLTENKPVEANDFFAAFDKMKLPYSVSDTSLERNVDTTSISADVF